MEIFLFKIFLFYFYFYLFYYIYIFPDHRVSILETAWWDNWEGSREQVWRVDRERELRKDGKKKKKKESWRENGENQWEAFRVEEIEVLEDEHIFHGEETFRYEHCGFPIHSPYYIIYHSSCIYLVVFWLSSVTWVYYGFVFFVIFSWHSL